MEYNLVDLEDFPIETQGDYRKIEVERNLRVNEYDLHCIDKLNSKQRLAFDSIIAAVHSNSSGVFFLDGPGGTGKTFLYRCLLAMVRSKGWIALATASSGIAASILSGSRIAHPRFKIPIDGDDKYVCNIRKQSADATLLKQSRLILSDEASMANRKCIESFNTTLQDLMNSYQLFGGKVYIVVVFGGDFRQTLPVIRCGKKEDFFEASLVKSFPIWPSIQHLRLDENMCTKDDQGFSEYLMRIGNGTEKTIVRDKIKIPHPFLLPRDTKEFALDVLFKAIYPNLNSFASDPYSLMNRSILTTKNEFVDEINSVLIE